MPHQGDQRSWVAQDGGGSQDALDPYAPSLSLHLPPCCKCKSFVCLQPRQMPQTWRCAFLFELLSFFLPNAPANSSHLSHASMYVTFSKKSSLALPRENSSLNLSTQCRSPGRRVWSQTTCGYSQAPTRPTTCWCLGFPICTMGTLLVS